MNDPPTRHLWLLPHEKLLLTWLNPLEQRKHSDNPSRLKMLREHGPAGLLLFTATALANAIAAFTVVAGAALLVAGAETAGYLFILVGVAHALLSMPRLLQIRACRPDELPSWTPRLRQPP